MDGRQANTPKPGGRRAPRLSAEERLRRARRRLAQRLEHLACITDEVGEPGGTDDEDYANWLDGLSPLAQALGVDFLEHCIPGDREAFRAYLENRAKWEARYPSRNGPMDEKSREQAEGVALLEKVKSRWR